MSQRKRGKKKRNKGKKEFGKGDRSKVVEKAKGKCKKKTCELSASRPNSVWSSINST
jgi:hypothetical protein